MPAPGVCVLGGGVVPGTDGFLRRGRKGWGAGVVHTKGVWGGAKTSLGLTSQAGSSSSRLLGPQPSLQVLSLQHLMIYDRPTAPTPSC